MIDATRADALATRLLAAYDAVQLVPRIDPPFSLDDGFVVQDRIRSLRIARGERQRGWKIGFTNRSLWQRYGVHAPIWGPVWDSTLTLLDGTEAQVSLAGFSQPRLEPEIVFGLGRVPDAGLDAAQLAACIDWLAHGFEIVHTHFDAWKVDAAECQADVALHGRLLVGPRVPVTRFTDLGAELAALQVELLAGGRVVDRGTASIVLDGPLNALRLWVDAMARQQPRWSIQPGDVVTTGTITDAYPLVPGLQCSSRLGDPRLAGLSLHTLG